MRALADPGGRCGSAFQRRHPERPMKSDPPTDLTVLCLDPLARPEALPPRHVSVRVEKQPFEVAAALVPASAPPDAELLAVRTLFERTGGLIPEREAALLLAAHDPEPGLAALVGARQVVTFVENGRRLVPLFQFDAAAGRPCAGVRAALAELVDVFDEHETAAWFGRPNPWLGGLAPAEAVRGAPGAVLQAARAERFIRRW
jgi:hypothetical protein